MSHRSHRHFMGSFVTADPVVAGPESSAPFSKPDGSAAAGNAPAAAAGLPPLLPREILFGNPEKAAPAISPDGTRLAYLAPHAGVMNLWVRAIGQSDDRPITRETVRPVRQFHWAENSRQVLFIQDAGGDENFHVYAADAEATEPSARDLTPFEGVRAYVSDQDPRHPDTVILAMNRRDATMMDAYRANLNTGELTLAAENPGPVVGWEADAEMKVRAAVAVTPDGGSEFWVRDDEASPWRTVLTHPFGEGGMIISFTRDGRHLYVTTDRDVNTQRLYLMDVATGERTLVHAREDVDLDEWLIHPTERTVQAVGYNRSRREWVALDPGVEKDLKNLAGIAPGDFTILSRDTADRYWTVTYIRDDGPVANYCYDRQSGTAEFLFTNRPALEGLTLAKMTPVDITARDGLVLPSYLTLPPGLPPKSLPLVLSVHGGPWARDMWGYNPEVQWLANRGYAVLEVNYRGSRGFGKAHTNAGNREWAGKMHDDLVDAVQWAIGQGYADPKRVAILGGSYGGYAALVGLTFTPDLFACGVDVVGPSNLITLLNSLPPYWKPARMQFIQRVGDPEKEPEFLKSRSPLYRADKIMRPLLIAQGANDPRVKQAESDQIVQAMRANGQEVTYLLFEDEGHGFARPENQVRFRAAAEKFLADYLGGRYEPAHPGEEPPLVVS